MSEASGIIAIIAFFVAVFVVGVLPFIINANLAKSRGQNVALMLLLTFFFSWAVTLFLAFSKKVETASPNFFLSGGKSDGGQAKTAYKPFVATPTNTESVKDK